MDVLRHFRDRVWMFLIELRQFDGALPVAAQEVPMFPDRAAYGVEFAGARWSLQLELRPAEDREDAVDGLLTCRVLGGCAESVNAGLNWRINDWSPEHYLLLPAAAYNGNRFPAKFMSYPPIVSDPAALDPQSAPYVSNVPRLELGGEAPSGLHLLTGDETTPCVAVYDPCRKQAAILLTTQGGLHGNHGLQVVETPNRRQAIVRLETPGVRAHSYTMLNPRSPSPDRGVTLTVDDKLEVRFRFFAFQAPELQSLFDRFVEVRKDLTGPVTLHHRIPFSECWAIQERKYNQENWNPCGYYSVGPRKDFEAEGAFAKYFDWQLGWVGGGMATLPMLFQGQARSRERALQNLDWLFTRGVDPESGMFYPVFHRGRPYSDNFRHTESTRWVLTRRLGDSLYFLAKQMDLLAKQEPGWQPPESWVRGMTRLGDGLVAVFEKNGQLGQFLDWRTWEIVAGGSTAGAMVPGALALGARILHRPDWQVAAQRMLEFFAAKDLRQGVTTGGPGEILQSPDSESAFALLESFVVLYEETGSARWLACARAMANQCATWCASYDYAFPPDSWFGRLDMRAAGSVWANVQNKHSAPGICTLSGDSLFKLWRATGERIYLDLIREIAHNLPQYLSRADRPVGDPDRMHPGYMCERVNFSDWEGVTNIGGSLFGSCWCELSLMLTTMEIPGLYVQTDLPMAVAFDHVDVSLPEPRGEGRLAVRVANPTAFDAEVKVLIETSQDARIRPLKANALWGCPVIRIPAGRIREFEVADGCISELAGG